MVRAVHMTIVTDGIETLATSRIRPHKNWRKFEKFSIFIMFILYALVEWKHDNNY